MSAVQAYRYFQLGFVPESILVAQGVGDHDALLVYPTSDARGSFYRAINLKDDGSRPQAVQLRYRTLTVVADTDDDFCNALTLMPGAEVVGVNGHGGKTALGFGDDDMWDFEPEREERYSLDFSDDLTACFSALRNPPTIVLFSCSTAEGGRGADNLANKVYAARPDARVLAPMTDISSKTTSVTYDPFSAVFYDINSPSTNVTYVAGPRSPP
jgi:hypothetical protein